MSLLDKDYEGMLPPDYIGMLMKFRRDMNVVAQAENIEDIKEIRVGYKLYAAISASTRRTDIPVYMPSLMHYQFDAIHSVPIVQDETLMKYDAWKLVFKGEEVPKADKRVMTYTNHEKLMEQLKYLGNRVEGWSYTKSTYEHPLVGGDAETKKALDFRTEELNALIDKVVDMINEVREGK